MWTKVISVVVQVAMWLWTNKAGLIQIAKQIAKWTKNEKDDEIIEKVELVVGEPKEIDEKKE